MKFFLSQDGFTMIQGLLLAGTVMGSSLIMTQLFKGQKKVQRSFETRDQIEDITDLVRTTLSDKNKCGNTIIKNGLQNSLNLPDEVHALTGVYNDNTTDTNLTPIIAVGENYLSNNVLIKSMNLKSTSDPYIKELVIGFERHVEDDASTDSRTKRGVGGKHLLTKVPLRVQFDSSGVFDSCYAIVEDKLDVEGVDSLDAGGIDLPHEFCQEMIENSSGSSALMWYEDRGRCLPNTQCSNKGDLFIGIDESGSVICKNLFEHIDSSIWIDSTPDSDCIVGSRVRLTKTSEGKVKIDCF